MSEKEKILILSVGGSPEPLIYSINEFKPDKIVFMHSPQTLYEIGNVLYKVDWDNYFPYKDDLNELVKAYNKEYNEFKENYNKSKECNDKLKYLEFEQIKELDYYEKLLNFLKINLSDILLEEDICNDIIFAAEIPDAEILDESFITSQKVFSKFVDVDKYEVKVDFTGGTKPMVSGIVLAVIEGNFPNFKFSYVGSKDSESRNKNGVGIVKDGSEITKMQINPYKKYAITEFKRGINFFNNYQFEAAKLNFEEAEKSLKEELSDKSKYNRNLASICLELVDFYHKWDVFDEKKSKKNNLFKGLKIILLKIEKDTAIYDAFLESDFYNQVLSNYEFLSLKFRGIELDEEESPEKSKMKNRIKYYLPDLLNNAYRRIEEGKYDDAVARLYRANELIAQINLTNYDLMLDKHLKEKKFSISIEKILYHAKNRSNYRNIENFIQKHSEWVPYEEMQRFRVLYGKPYDIYGTLRLGNDLSYELLEMFDFKNSNKFETLNQNLKGRNTSILAHGLEPIRKKYATDLYYSTLDYAKDFFPDLEELMEKSKFPKLKTEIIRN